jgi:hypothetical protein
VVGCRRAWRELRTGNQVAVHGDAGLVARLHDTATSPATGEAGELQGENSEETKS